MCTGERDRVAEWRHWRVSVYRLVNDSISTNSENMRVLSIAFDYKFSGSIQQDEKNTEEISTKELSNAPKIMIIPFLVMSGEP